MKIKYEFKKIETLNKPGNFIVSLQSGGTRTIGKVYQVIKDPKKQAIDPDFMWYISDKGHPVKCGIAKQYTFRQATGKDLVDAGIYPF